MNWIIKERKMGRGIWLVILALKHNSVYIRISNFNSLNINLISWKAYTVTSSGENTPNFIF